MTDVMLVFEVLVVVEPLPIDQGYVFYVKNRTQFLVKKKAKQR